MAWNRRMCCIVGGAALLMLLVTIGVGAQGDVPPTPAIVETPGPTTATPPRCSIDPGFALPLPAASEQSYDPGFALPTPSQTIDPRFALPPVCGMTPEPSPWQVNVPGP